MQRQIRHDLREAGVSVSKTRTALIGQTAHCVARFSDLVATKTTSNRTWEDLSPGIRRAHLQLMPHLDLDGTRITELARRAEITKQAVGQLVSDMERAGYVERFGDPDDQRAKIVKLTQRGRDAILDGLTVFSELAAELGGEVGEGEIDRLVDRLETLMRALERRMV